MEIFDKFISLSCIEFLEKKAQNEIIKKMIPYLKYMNNEILLIFANDAVSNEY